MSYLGARRRRGPGHPAVTEGTSSRAPHRPADGRRSGFLRRARRLSLRSRLLLGLVVIAAVGLGVANAAIYGEIRSYLLGQLDNQVAQEALAVQRAPGLADCSPRTENLSVGDWIFVYNPSSLQQECPPLGVVLYQNSTLPAGSQPSVPMSLLQEVNRSGNGALAAASSSSGEGYELYAAAPGPASGFNLGIDTIVVVAVPLSGVDGTMHRLLLIDLAVSIAVLAVLAALGYAVVRVGLRPLEEIEATAGKIAAGDLSRRVERDEPGTEVGRLGASLNAMLGQIEHAFSEQQSSERRMRQFIADAAHELRTPLTSIRGYAELFRRGAAARPEDLARSMRRIEEEATRMGVLVEDLLLLARLDQGRPLEWRTLDLSAIAADAAADAQAVQPDRPISYDSSGTVLVKGDEARLRQVAANLVQNALVHTPPGTPVSVSVRRQGSVAVLEVADAGPGIAPDHAARIFERFYRADSSRARNSGGTGLGLAIVASLAAAHGGRASVETAPGAGARFRVELPALDAASRPAAPLPADAGDEEVRAGRPPGRPPSPALPGPPGTGAQRV
jgi:two-component system OmpR family sensor kinase